MNICHFVSNYPHAKTSKIYGESAVFLNLCTHLAKIGHKVHVFTPSEDDKDYIENYNSLTVYRFSSIFGYGVERLSLGILYKPFNHYTDIVHVHSGISVSLIAGFLYSTIKKKPLVMNWHSDPIQEHGRFSGKLASLAVYFNKKYMADIILSRVDIIVSPSECYTHKSHFLKKYQEKIVVIPNGINLQDFDIQNSKEECKYKFGLNGMNVILFVGVLLPLKGLNVLLEAIPKILKEHNDTFFLFVGGGDIDSYKQMSADLCIEKHVRFTGYVYENISFYYKASDIFVLPSLTECFGIVNLEAMACGVPIVASDVGGIPDIVKHGENGLLFPAGDSNALAESIICLLNNKNLREKMGENGKQKVGYYSWERISKMMEMLYKRLVDSYDKKG